MNLIFILIIIVVIILYSVIWYISTTNKLKRYAIKVEEAFSGIDVALEKRYDVLTKMIEVVKGYSKFEKETLFKAIKLRSNMSISEINDAYNSMNTNFKKIYAIAENNPELKANENYMILQKSIVDVEEHLQAARRLYNSNVSSYNQLLISFPITIIAKNIGMAKKDFFEIDETERENITTDL